MTFGSCAFQADTADSSWVARVRGHALRPHTGRFLLAPGDFDTVMRLHALARSVICPLVINQSQFNYVSVAETSLDASWSVPNTQSVPSI